MSRREFSRPVTGGNKYTQIDTKSDEDTRKYVLALDDVECNDTYTESNYSIEFPLGQNVEIRKVVWHIDTETNGAESGTLEYSLLDQEWHSKEYTDDVEETLIHTEVSPDDDEDITVHESYIDLSQGQTFMDSTDSEGDGYRLGIKRVNHGMDNTVDNSKIIVQVELHDRVGRDLVTDINAHGPEDPGDGDGVSVNTWG